MLGIRQFTALALAACTMAPVAYAQNTTTAPIPGTFTNLGQPLTNVINQDGAIGWEGNRLVEYLVVKGANNSTFFAVVDVLENKKIKHIPLPGVTGAWAVTIASDGKVYIGTHYGAKLLQYTPGADRVRNVATLGEESHVFSIAAGKDGKVYAATYPHARVFEFSPDTEKLRDYGPLSKTEKYVRSVTYDTDRDMIYACVGGQSGELVRLDVKTGQQENLLNRLFNGKPPKLELPYHISYAKGKLFAKVWPLLIIDVKTMTVDHYNPQNEKGVIGMGGQSVFTHPEDSDHIYFGAQTLYRYNIKTKTFQEVGPFQEFHDARIVKLNHPDYPGYTAVGAGKKGINSLLNLETKRLTTLQPKANLGGPVLIQSLSRGFDGNIYIGGYAGDSGFNSYLPAKNTFTPVQQFGQTESVSSVGNKIYAGNYPGAFIWEYDPALPWNAKNPHQILRLDRIYQQDRPFILLGNDEQNKLFVGTVPGCPHHQGALTIYDVATQKSQTFNNLVKNQGVVSLAYHQGLLYGGTTIDGGLGTKAAMEKAGKFFIFDTRTNQKVLELTPNETARSVTGLLVGPDQNIWGVADDVLFKYDPQQQKIVYSKPHFSRLKPTVWANASLKIGKDGFVYGTTRDQLFFKVNPQNMEFTIINEKGGRYLETDDEGNFYMSKDSYLWRYQIP